MAAKKKARKPSQKQLEAAFNEVCNKKDWKAPINKIIAKPDAAKESLIWDAVAHFTATEAYFVPVGKDKVRVLADGYRAGCPEF